jgi:eukaryotic-like serine/threonine-protein kinase
MGEVWRARDDRLGRDVAIKTLLGTSDDPQWRRRFQLEARAAASLNHANIVTVFDVGETDGIPYLVTELLVGQTLRERLKSGPLRPSNALELGAQIAEGLSVAHERGIVHRDLKPENLFVTEDGRCKILDFGVAKTMRAASSDHGATAPTSLTLVGEVIGTTAYLSPEQARGEAADPRSDLFALGAILHEMITGAKPFERRSVVETLAAILSDDPELLPADVRRAYPTTSATIVRLVRKDPRERFQSALDLAFVLRSELEGVEPSAREGREEQSETVAGAGRDPAGPEPEVTLRVGREVRFQQITFRQGSIWNARFAPDGVSVIYTGAWEGRAPELFWSHPEFPEARSLGFKGAELHGISKRNELALSIGRVDLGGYTKIGTLARVPMTGGAAREMEQGVREADWIPGEDTLAAAIRDSENRTRLEFPLGHVVYQSSGWISALRVSPDGLRVAFLDHWRHGDIQGRVAVVDTSGFMETLSPDWAVVRGLAWKPDGTEIWFAAARDSSPRDLRAVDLHGRDRLVYSSPIDLTIHDIAPDGRVLLTSSVERCGTLALPPGAHLERDLSWHDWSLVTDISPDGRVVVILEDGLSCALATLYLRGTDGAPAMRLGQGGVGALSPDGKWVAARDLERDELLLLPTGAGKTRSFPLPFSPMLRPAWFPDGSRVLVPGRDTDGSFRLWEVRVDSGVQAGAPCALRPVVPECLPNPVPVLSPEGMRVAGNRADERCWIFPIDGAEPREIPGAKPLEGVLQWTPDGRSVYMAARGEVPMRVDRVDLETGARELWREIAPSDMAGVTALHRLQVTPEGHAYAYSYTQLLSELHVVSGLR